MQVQEKIAPLTNDEWEFLKIRAALALKAEEEEPGVLDERIVALIRALCQMPGVAPVWSCSGHSQAEYIQKHPDEDPCVFREDAGYFVIAGNTPEFERSADFIESRSMRLFEELQYSSNGGALRLTAGHKILIGGFEALQRIYPCFGVRVRYEVSQANLDVVTEFWNRLTNDILAYNDRIKKGN